MPTSASCRARHHRVCCFRSCRMLSDPVIVAYKRMQCCACGMCLQIHHFGDIGYRHNSFTNCPAKLRNNCACDAMKSVDFHSPLNSFGQCHSLWKKVLRDKAAAADKQ